MSESHSKRLRPGYLLLAAAVCLISGSLAVGGLLLTAVQHTGVPPAASKSWPHSATPFGARLLLVDDDDDDDDGGDGNDDDGGGGGNDTGGRGGDDSGGGGDDSGGGGGDDGGAPGSGDDDGGPAGGDDDGGPGAGDDDGGAGGGDDGGGGSSGDDGGRDDSPGGLKSNDDGPDDGGRRGDDGPAGGSGPGRDEDDDGPPVPQRDTFTPFQEIRDEAGERAIKGQIIAIDPSDADLRLASALGYRVRARLRLGGLRTNAVILDIPPRADTIAALRLLRQRVPGTRFDYVHLYEFKPSAEFSVPYRQGLEIYERRSLSLRSDLRLGIIDTGVNVLDASVSSAKIVRRSFFEVQSPIALGHGTAVASILVDQRNGLLPNGRLYSANAFVPTQGAGPVGSVVEIVRALDWLAREGIAVINMSLAGPPNAALEVAVASAIDRGHIIVAAVGNAGPAARPLFPASYSGVVGATAIDMRGQVFRRAAQGPQVDFSAPGVNVPGAGAQPGVFLHTGTSFAAPYVAAQLALNLTRPNRQQAQLLVQGLALRARDLGAPGRDPVYGFGMVRLGE